MFQSIEGTFFRLSGHYSPCHLVCLDASKSAHLGTKQIRHDILGHTVTFRLVFLAGIDLSEAHSRLITVFVRGLRSGYGLIDFLVARNGKQHEASGGNKIIGSEPLIHDDAFLVWST